MANAAPHPNHYVEEKTKAQKDLAQWRAFLEQQIRAKPSRKKTTRTPRGRGQPQTSWQDLWELQKGRCWICGKALERSFVSRDHLHPVSRGGKNRPNNILLAHRICNGKRGNKGSYTREEALAILERLEP